MQVKESVNASNFLLVGNQTGTGNRASGKSIETNDFASFLTGSRNEPDKRISKGETGQKISDDGRQEKQDICPKEEVKQENTAEQPGKAPGDTVKETASEEIGTGGIAEESGDLSCEEAEEVLEIIGDILQMIMNQLQLSPEELAGRLDEFGMEASDLMTADGLKEFFLNLESADVSDLIANEKLNQKLEALTAAFNSVLQENGLSRQDLEAVIGQENGKELFSDDLFLQSFSVKTEEQSKNMEEPIPLETEEPEVIIMPNKESAGQNKGLFQESQNASVYDQNPEGEVLKQSVGKEKHGFENPILQAIQDAVNQTGEAPSVAEHSVRGMDIIEQIVERVRINMNQDTTSMELQLYPEHLGRIQIHVVSKEGIMTAKIVAETEAAKQAIEGGLTSLKDTMQQQNLKVDAIEVMVSTTGFERGSEEQDAYEQENTAKSRRKIDLSELEEDIPEEEAAEIERMKAVGSSVSYMA